MNLGVQDFFILISILISLLFLFVKGMHKVRYDNMLKSFISRKYISSYKGKNISSFSLILYFIFINGITLFIYKLYSVLFISPYSYKISYYFIILLSYIIFDLVRLFVLKIISFPFQKELVKKLFFLSSSFRHFFAIWVFILAIFFLCIDFKSNIVLFYIIGSIIVIIYFAIPFFVYSKLFLRKLNDGLIYFLYLCTEFSIIYVLYWLYNNYDMY